MIRVCHGSLGLRARTCQGVWSRGETGLPAWGKAGERGAWSRSTEDNPTPVARPCSSEGFQRHPPGGAAVGSTLWLGPSPVGYLFQNPGHAVKQHPEEVPLKEGPLGLVGVQWGENQGPAPGTDAGAALLELEQEGGLRGGPWSGGPGTQWATREGGLWAQGWSWACPGGAHRGRCL